MREVLIVISTGSNIFCFLGHFYSYRKINLDCVDAAIGVLCIKV